MYDPRHTKTKMQITPFRLIVACVQSVPIYFIKMTVRKLYRIVDNDLRFLDKFHPFLRVNSQTSSTSSQLLVESFERISFRSFEHNAVCSGIRTE